MKCYNYALNPNLSFQIVLYWITVPNNSLILLRELGWHKITDRWYNGSSTPKHKLQINNFISNLQNTVWMGWVGLDWIGLAWIGLGWIGYDWIGMDWIGLNWIGYDWIRLTYIGFDWIGFDWLGLDWVELNWIGLDWIWLD